MRRTFLAAAFLVAVLAPARAEMAAEVAYYPVPAGAGPHDVAVGPDGIVWYTAQRQAALGRLDPRTGAVKQIPLGAGSRPHGVIVAADGAIWITDSGLNANLRVDPTTEAVRVFPAPEGTPYMNLNTGTFDGRGLYWFTGQAGYYGWVDPKSGQVQVYEAPRGRGPYGITATPDGTVYYASLAGNHIARIDAATGKAVPIDPPTAGQGARRVWSDSHGQVWVSEWNSGNVSRYDPKSGSWKEWKLPGSRPRTYSVYVDDKDIVWLTDFSANAIVAFDPKTERFASFPSDKAGANVRQMLGRSGEAWGAESGTDRLVVVRLK